MVLFCHEHTLLFRCVFIDQPKFLTRLEKDPSLALADIIMCEFDTGDRIDLERQY